MEFLSEFGMFFLKAATLTVAAFLVIWVLARLFIREASPATGVLRVVKLNQQLRRMARAIHAKTLGRAAYKRLRKQEKRQDKERERHGSEGAPGTERRSRVFVLEFKGDVKASAVAGLRREITALLTVAEPGDEAVVRLDSGGGLVNEYGLAASQLARLRDRGVPLTVCVDRIAASGGYLMACVADRILAAPFAVVGSIGVVATVPNLRRLLQKHDVEVEQHTAGDYKRTLSLLGENTDQGRAKFKQQLQESHGLFKAYVKQFRPDVDLERVATGEYWYGSQAVELGLVDELRTSDDLLLARSGDADLLAVSWEARKTLGTRLSSVIEATVGRLVLRGAQAAHDSQFV